MFLCLVPLVLLMPSATSDYLPAISMPIRLRTSGIDLPLLVDYVAAHLFGGGGISDQDFLHFGKIFVSEIDRSPLTPSSPRR